MCNNTKCIFFSNNVAFYSVAYSMCDSQWAGLDFLLTVSFRYVVGGVDPIIDTAHLRRPVPVIKLPWLNLCLSSSGAHYAHLVMFSYDSCIISPVFEFLYFISLKYLTAFKSLCVVSHLLVTSFEPGCDTGYTNTCVLFHSVTALLILISERHEQHICTFQCRRLTRQITPCFTLLCGNPDLVTWQDSCATELLLLSSVSLILLPHVLNMWHTQNVWFHLCYCGTIPGARNICINGTHFSVPCSLLYKK